MSVFGDILERYVKVPCQNCGNGIEFDANQLAGYNTCVVPCPHCGLDTDLVVAKEDRLPTAIAAQNHPTPATSHYVTIACEYCFSGIEFDANLLGGESCRMPCPHCSKETTLFVVPEENAGRFSDGNGYGSDAESVAPPAIEEPATCYIQQPSLPDVRSLAHSLPPPIPRHDSCFTIPAAEIARSGAEWVPSGVEITVAGFRISGGMLYVGQHLACVHGSGVEPALVNPGKAVARSAFNCHVGMMGYWPNYSAISPEARASYLHWLSTGRFDPEADVGYVFLYFYGLERRVLVDAIKDSQAKAEIPIIEREITRLVDIYGRIGSFRGYAESLLNLIAASKLGSANLEKGDPPLGTGNQGLSLDLRVGLGLHAQLDRPLPVRWALAWLQSDFTVHLRTPASRCPELFAKLFALEYTSTFGDGLRIRENKSRLKITHRPASGSFSFQTATVELDLPDVCVSNGPIDKLRALADCCTERLDAYSRFIGRNPEDVNGLNALLLLPKTLWPTTLVDALALLRFRSIENRGAIHMAFSDLVNMLPSGVTLNRPKFSALSRALGEFGLGIEPDPRFGGALPEVGNTIVIFSCEGLQQDQSLSTEFASASLLLHLASAVAGSDGEFAEAEESFLLNYVEHGLKVPVPEQKRLAARIRLHRAQPPGIVGLKNRVSELDRGNREAIGDFLVLVVHADGIVKPDEVRAMEKLWKFLDLDQADLYTRLHGPRKTDAVSEALLASSPRLAQPSARSGVLDLDPARVAALIAETSKVSERLGAIYAQAETPEPVTQIPNTDPETVQTLILGLDPIHHGLLQVLRHRAQWTRSEFQELCLERGLMVDGAIECINEAAFARFDEPLIEENETIEIRCDLIQELAL